MEETRKPEQMVYAPILIPTLCRYEKFARCVESLKRNGWAKYTQVYIALDYPAKESHWEGYRRICAYLEGDFSQFAGFHVVKRTENYGSRRNSVTLRDEILEKYDRYIRTDDDVEFSENFLEYMNKCLAYYQFDDRVIAVCGYAYPLPWKVSENSTVFKENFIVPMWGTGFWKNKLSKVSEHIVKKKQLVHDFDRVMREKAYGPMIDSCRIEYINSCLDGPHENNWICRLTDAALRMYCGLEDRYVVSPVISKARNHGFDGSGECCQNTSDGMDTAHSGNYPFHMQPVDESSSFELIEDNLCAVNDNRALMNAFDRQSIKRKLRAQCKYYLYRLLGKETFFRLKRKRKP